MTIAQDLADVDNRNVGDKNQARRLIRANALLPAMLSRVGVVTSLNANLVGLTGTITIEFDSALAASYGHASPVFVHPQGDLVLYVIIKLNGEQKFPTPSRTTPLMVRNPFFTDGAGNENPAAAGLAILADLVR